MENKNQNNHQQSNNINYTKTQNGTNSVIQSKNSASNNKLKNFLLRPDKINISHHIYVTIAIFATLFLALICYLIVFYCKNSTAFISNGYNKRESVLARENLRGNIYSADGEILAYSIQNEDGSQTRVYPYGSLFAHTVGYSTKGKYGVEELENYYLINTSDSLTQRAQNASEGKLNSCYNVTTTFDVELQKIADDYLGNYNGAVIFTEVKTGKILAMVSHPTFDPNNIDSVWDVLTQDNESSVLMNRVTQGQYPPGSTFKIITGLEYYRQYGNTYKKYEYSCNGYYVGDTYRINCYHGTVHGSLNFVSSFAKSCNSSFANIGMSLNRNEFSQTLDSLLFNGDLPSQLPFTQSTIKIDKNTDDYNMMQTSIGQGKTSISPYHMNLITMAIANDGLLIEPYMIDNITTADGLIIEDYSGEIYGNLMTEEEAEFLRILMKNVVEEGTATRLKNDIYTAAGKTGSAEYNNIGDSHAWFTGYAPVENPEVAVTIIIEAGGTGGEKAVPLAKLMFDYYFTHY